MIKTIHYCWFGKKEKPKNIKKCIKSWEKFAPDFNIVEWNEFNFDINSAPTFVKQAYKAKKYAFVSDYVRFKVLNKYGGLYFDTDLELINNIPDYSNYFFVACYERPKIVNTAFLYSTPNNAILENCCHYYETTNFIFDEGGLNLKTSPILISEILLKIFPMNNDGSTQTFEHAILLSRDYYYPKNLYDGIWDTIITTNTIGIHHYNASWVSQKKDFKKIFLNLKKHLWLKRK